MDALELLKSVRFVVDRQGRPSAVQLDLATWQALLEWLEEAEDRAAVKAWLPRLRQGPAGALRWDEVKGDWVE